MNIDKVLCGSFGFYPSYAAGILNTVNQINFYVVCCENLSYADYVEKCISSKECSVTYRLYTGDSFLLSSGSEIIALCFEGRQFQKPPSELILVQIVLKRMRLSPLPYGIACISKRVAYITNEVMSSKHERWYKLFDTDLHLPKRLANYELFTQSYSENTSWCDFPFGTLYFTKQSHRMLKEPQFHCKLCVKKDLQVYNNYVLKK